jgi:hypothetical protein
VADHTDGLRERLNLRAIETSTRVALDGVPDVRARRQVRMRARQLLAEARATATLDAIRDEIDEIAARFDLGADAVGRVIQGR